MFCHLFLLLLRGCRDSPNVEAMMLAAHKAALWEEVMLECAQKSVPPPRVVVVAAGCRLLGV